MATTVESLLSSLQSHLNSQTPLIPVLHAQLGLPSTALTDDLSELHAALVDCVDRKIDERRKTVSEWMDKCEDLEGKCVKLSRALGSHVKVVATSVGEIRKQQVKTLVLWPYVDILPVYNVVYRFFPNALSTWQRIRRSCNSYIKLSLSNY